MPDSKPLHVTLPISPEDADWLRQVGNGGVEDGIQTLITLYRLGKRPVVDANGRAVTPEDLGFRKVYFEEPGRTLPVYREGTSLPRRKRPIYQAEE